MSSEDYLIRYFRQLGNVLASIFEYRKRKEYSLAMDEIDQALDSWFDIDAGKNDLNEEYIVRLLKNHSGGYESEKSLAELLYQKAITYRDMGKMDEAAQVAELALVIFKEIDKESGDYSVDNQHKIAGMANLIQKQ